MRCIECHAYIKSDKKLLFCSESCERAWRSRMAGVFAATLVIAVAASWTM
jgi:hypothetical protein